MTLTNDGDTQFDPNSAVAEQGLATRILLEPNEFEADAKLVRRMLRKQTIVSDKVLRQVMKRAKHTMDKMAVRVEVEEGCFIEDDGPADRNSAIAGKLILEIAKYQQDIQQHRDKMRLAERKLEAGVGKGNTVNNNTLVLGSIMDGHEPLSPAHAKEQIEVVLRRVLERSAPPVAIEATAEARPTSLDDI